LVKRRRKERPGDFFFWTGIDAGLGEAVVSVAVFSSVILGISLY
jgi:hypothetical protein